MNQNESNTSFLFLLVLAIKDLVFFVSSLMPPIIYLQKNIRNVSFFSEAYRPHIMINISDIFRHDI